MERSSPTEVHRPIFWAFAAACAAIVVYTLIVIKFEWISVENGARTEARDLALAVGFSSALGREHLAAYVAGLSNLYQRDIVIVDKARRGIADADPRELGKVFSGDPNGEVASTLLDGEPRYFVERNDQHPDGAKQVAVAVRDPAAAAGNAIRGAVILEYTEIHRELLAAATPYIVAIASIGLFCATLVAFCGKRLNSSLSRRLIEERHLASQIEHLAFHDKLTQLPNRAMFSKELEAALRVARVGSRRLAVYFLDLDRFKNINDTLGHPAGDLLLQEMAKRLKACLKEGDLVARLGGDEFVVLVRDAPGQAQLMEFAQALLTATARSFKLRGHEFHVTASIGISLFPTDGSDEKSLMKNADIAMYQAKENGKNNAAFYSPLDDLHSLEKLAFESSVKAALDANQFQVHYQPKVDSRTNQINGVEALLRWFHPDLGLVSPSKFIPVAEEDGSIVRIGLWVLRTACLQQVAWRDLGYPPLHVSVNLSARQFFDDSLLDAVKTVLAETRIDPTFLELEITESMLMKDTHKASSVLARFKELGIKLSLDDFGTGYSSLSNLKRFPIDTIKVDRSFIRGLGSSEQDRAIADAIITMATSLNMKIVAEGVEKQAQVDFLRARACDQFQGFFFSKAVPADSISELLAHQPWVIGQEVTVQWGVEGTFADSAVLEM